MGNREILIVEDDAAFRNSIKFALKNEDYTFFEAESVRDGVGKINEHPNIQVILLDISLPDGTGKDFLEQVRRHASRHRVIILTAHEEELTAKQAGEYGYSTICLKQQNPLRNQLGFQSIRHSKMSKENH